MLLLLLSSVLCIPLQGIATEPAGKPEIKATDNQTLKAIFDADQSDRASGALQRDSKAVMVRDRSRRDQTLNMLREGRLHTALDYFHAAMVFQHSADDIRLAHALSTVANTLDPGNKIYSSLVAMSWDRMLMQQRQPQWYGTQYQDSDQGVFLFPVAEGAVGDTERERLGVPTLAQARARVADIATMMGRKPRLQSPSIEELRRVYERDAAKEPVGQPSSEAE